jgi:ribosomal protein L37E
MKLQCVCGKLLNVPDSMVGERIRCKDCGKVLTIRPSTEDSAPASAPFDMLAVKGHRKCGKCGRSWPMRDKICTACGIDLDTGAALYTSLDASDEQQRPPVQRKPGLVKRLLRLIRGH